MSAPDPRHRSGSAAVPALVCILALLAGFSGTRPIAAASPGALPADTAPVAPPADTVARLARTVRERAPATAIALAFPFGSGDDAPGEGGSAALLARALEAAAGRELPDGMARVEVAVERGEFVITFVSASEEISELWPRAARALFETPLPDPIIEGARAELLSPLRFERGAPVRLFELEVGRVLAGFDHPWARSPRGIEAELERVPTERIRTLQALHVRPEAARASMVGPSGVVELISLHSREGAEGAATRPVDGPLASAGSRLQLEREVVNSWIMVGWPAPPDASRTLLDFAAGILEERLTPMPADPALFSVRVRVVDFPEGPVVQAVAAMIPGEAGRWETRIIEEMASLAAAPLAPDFLAIHRRRFTSRTLLDEAPPEGQAARMARDLLRGTPPRELDAELRALSAFDLQATLARMAPPRILVYGPAPQRPGS